MRHGNGYRRRFYLPNHHCGCYLNLESSRKSNGLQSASALSSRLVHLHGWKKSSS